MKPGCWFDHSDMFEVRCQLLSGCFVWGCRVLLWVLVRVLLRVLFGVLKVVWWLLGDVVRLLVRVLL